MIEQNNIQLVIPTSVTPTSLLGPQDEFLHLIEDNFNSRISLSGNTLQFSGDPLELQTLTTLFSALIKTIEAGDVLTRDEVKRNLELMKTGELAPQPMKGDVILSHRGRAIRPKTPTQKRYVDAIRHNTITFGIGPAGTGKTYLAMAMAVRALETKQVSRIVLTRPVVEAGENLGFLPGTLTEKIDPYIRPLYDALFEMMEGARASKFLQDGTIEIAPLAFMRGRTLNDAFVVLDEAQNTTPQQMKMFLTRLGLGSKMVITGDITQADLPKGISGLKTVRQVLDGVEDIEFCEFKNADVVRHSLVAKIVAAYARAEEMNLRL
jgi:phosphate starvation-inducible protein PhoH and related proteins